MINVVESGTVVAVELTGVGPRCGLRRVRCVARLRCVEWSTSGSRTEPASSRCLPLTAAGLAGRRADRNRALREDRPPHWSAVTPICSVTFGFCVGRGSRG
jgi:hypothetical protein